MHIFDYYSLAIKVFLYLLLNFYFLSFCLKSSPRESGSHNFSVSCSGGYDWITPNS